MSVISELALCVQAGVPVLLWGAPGVGKTATIKSIANALGLLCEPVIASVREPADFAGLPIIREDGVVMEAPAWAKRLARSGRGLLFLDEVSTAPPAVQAALLRVVLERVVGDLALPDGVAVIAAANSPEQAAGGWDLSAPLANRFCHLSWQPNAQEWVAGMLAGFPTPEVPLLPDGWEAGIPATRALVAAFIRHRPHLLLQVPESEEQAGHAWPSPRSWDTAARLLAAATAAMADDDVIALLIIGCVGDGTGMEFLSWRKNLDLPDPEEALANPEGFNLPERGDAAFAALTAIVAAAVGNLTPARWSAAWQVLARAADQGAKDIAAAAAKALAGARKPSLPLPKREMAAFIPLLKDAGML